MVPLRTQVPRAALLVAALALGACGTTGSIGSVAEDADATQATPANIASLSEVIQRNPNDAQAYNMRGSVLGRAGRNQEALADFNRAIEIDAAEEAIASRRFDVEDGVGQLEDRGVEGAAAEIVDQDAAVEPAT